MSAVNKLEEKFQIIKNKKGETFKAFHKLGDLIKNLKEEQLPELQSQIQAAKLQDIKATEITLAQIKKIKAIKVASETKRKQKVKA